MTSRGGLNPWSRLGLRSEHETWMMMSGLLALCTVLVVGALVLPIFGPRVAAISAVTLVLGIVVICYMVCVSLLLPWRHRP